MSDILTSIASQLQGMNLALSIVMLLFPICLILVLLYIVKIFKRTERLIRFEKEKEEIRHLLGEKAEKEKPKEVREEMREEEKKKIPIFDVILHPFSAKKYVCIILNSPKDAVVKDLDVSDGQIMYRDKIWSVDESIPIRLKTPFGEKFMYILHWKCPKPLEVDEDKMKLVPTVTPEFLKRLVEIKLVNLLSRRQLRMWEEGTSRRILTIVMIVSAALLAFFVLRALRIIPW